MYSSSCVASSAGNSGASVFGDWYKWGPNWGRDLSPFPITEVTEMPAEEATYVHVRLQIRLSILPLPTPG